MNTVLIPNPEVSVPEVSTPVSTELSPSTCDNGIIVQEVNTVDVKPALTLEQTLIEKAKVLHAKITGLNTEYTNLIAQIQALKAVHDVKAGDSLVVVYNKKEVQGSVLGAEDTPKGFSIKLLVGAGFSAEVITVKAEAVLRVVKYEA